MYKKKGRDQIVINDEVIAAGKSKLVQIAIDRLPTGTMIDIPVYVFNAKNPGPTLLVQAGLHGDEVNGIEIVRRMLQDNRFTLESGAVVAVPILNIFGFIHFSRDVPDGKDVNRSFPGSKKGSLASRIAYHYTKQLLPLIDYCIDLHTGGGQRHNYPQVRYTPEDEDSMLLAKIFNAPFMFPASLIKGSFRKEMYGMGKPTVVFEAGESMRFDEYSILEGMQGILNVMKHLKMIDSISTMYTEKSESVSLNETKWLRAPTAGMFVPQITNGMQVEKGKILGVVINTYEKKGKTLKMPMDGYIICVNHQAVVNQGDALFNIGKKA